MKKLNFILLCILAYLHIDVNTQAQNIGINPTGTSPNASAMLDVAASDKGILIPRVSLTSTTDVTTIANPATSLLVYNTNTGMINGSEGFYYWNGAQWTKIQDASSTNNNSLWMANGNNIYIPNTGRVGIGTNIPATPLQVIGHQPITLPNGGNETSHVTAIVTDTTAASGTGSKIGLYAVVKNHTGANVGVLAEGITKDSVNNFGIIGNIIGPPQSGGLGYAIGAVDAVKNGTGALYVDGHIRYTGIPNAYETGATLTNAGNGVMQWRKPVAFKTSGALLDTIGSFVDPTKIIRFNYLDYDVSNNYNTTTHTFTAPVAGIYHFNYSVVIVNPPPQTESNISIRLLLNSFFTVSGSEVIHQHRSTNSSFGYNHYTIQGSADVQLAANDTINVLGSYNYAGIGIVSANFLSTHFSGFLIN
jgi:hypothetical protein